MPTWTDFMPIGIAMAQEVGENVEGSADVGSVAWSTVAIGIAILLAAMIAGFWQYSRWRQTRTAREAANHEQATRDLYNRGGGAE